MNGGEWLVEESKMEEEKLLQYAKLSFMKLPVHNVM